MAIATPMPIGQLSAIRNRGAGRPGRRGQLADEAGRGRRAEGEVQVRSSAGRPGQRAEAEPDQPGGVPVGRRPAARVLDLRVSRHAIARPLPLSCPVTLHRFVCPAARRLNPRRSDTVTPGTPPILWIETEFVSGRRAKLRAQ